MQDVERLEKRIIKAAAQAILDFGLIAEGDRITDPATGNRWIVTAERTPSSVLQALVRVIVREMDASVS